MPVLPHDLSVVDLVARALRLGYEQRLGAFARNSLRFFKVNIAFGHRGWSPVDHIQDFLARHIRQNVKTLNSTTPGVVGAMSIHAIAITDAVACLFRKDDKGEWNRLTTDTCQIGNAARLERE